MASARAAGGTDGIRLRHVEVEELDPLREHRGRERVLVHAVHQGDLHRDVGREVADHVREVAAGLLVLPGAGEEHRHVDVVDERRRRERVGRRAAAVGVGPDLAEHAGSLQPERLVGAARLVTGRDALARPPLAASRAGRGSGIGLAVLRPPEREAVVEDAPGIQRGVGVVEHRERRDRGQVRRARVRDEQLGDARERDAHHADGAVEDPRLRGDGLDHVVPVERLELLEVVVRAAGAAGAAEVHAHGGEAEQLRDPRRRLRRVGVRRVVPGVLDHGGVGPTTRGSGQRDVDRQLGAVARGQVAVPRAEVLARVERLRRRVGGARHRHRRRLGVPDADDVARARAHVAEEHAAGGVDRARRDLPAVGRPEHRGGAGRGSGDRDLLDARLHREVGARAGGGLRDGRETGDRHRDAAGDEREPAEHDATLIEGSVGRSSRDQARQRTRRDHRGLEWDRPGDRPPGGRARRARVAHRARRRSVGRRRGRRRRGGDRAGRRLRRRRGWRRR